MQVNTLYIPLPSEQQIMFGLLKKTFSSHSHTCISFVQGSQKVALLFRDLTIEKLELNTSTLVRAQGPAASLLVATIFIPALAAARATSRFLSSIGKSHLNHIKYGVRTARRGQDPFSSWCGKTEETVWTRHQGTPA